ncbi:hypothetical protein AVEN_129086-1 [Araneus ventricosus]|uniref:Uncharacterized protein n=1 Tax=Araneus ventricosus TaxID=182803 RepID=A0A4Y2MRR2_ARAVE|nr:hypothetical protein AVEN_129086-1 [Araneus ventricosus]
MYNNAATSYKGPYQVKHRGEKYFDVYADCEVKRIAIYRLKSTFFIEDETDDHSDFQQKTRLPKSDSKTEDISPDDRTPYTKVKICKERAGRVGEKQEMVETVAEVVNNNKKKFKF